MRNGLSARVNKLTVLILLAISVMLSGSTDATLSVKPGHSIQSAINAANPGQIIEVQNGTFYERINITKPLILKGVGKPIIDAGGIGSAITIYAGDSTLVGFTATGSGNGAEDAGIKVLSNKNIIKDNTAIKNNAYGMILNHVDNNTVFLNTILGNKKTGIWLDHSNNNNVWGNNVSKNGNGIAVETSRSNTLKSNNLTRNKIGINISNNDISESITQHGKGVSIKYGSIGKLPAYNIDKNSTGSSAGVNLIYQNNLQDNGQNAFDDSNNKWDNGKSGNHYSNYDSYEQGCIDRNRDGICDNSYSVPGGHNVDQLPKASPDAILSYKSKGRTGTELKIYRKTYMPDMEIDLTYKVPRNFSGWVGIVEINQPRGKSSQEKALSYQNLVGLSGILKLKAPANSGSYDIRLYNATSSEELASLNFIVKVPTVAAAPDQVYTCGQITVTYSGAPGYDNDWIGMYRSGSSDADYLSRQYLVGKENGTLNLGSPDPGSYDFRMFENNTYKRLAASQNVEVKTFNGTKVEVSSTHVVPGGTVTVTYWGAPSSGTGIIGMYGMTRPDKFPLETRPLGSGSCGRMTWRLPYDPGQYDFRMFYSAITDVGQGAYQILGQSDVVTVG